MLNPLQPLGPNIHKKKLVYRGPHYRGLGVFTTRAKDYKAPSKAPRPEAQNELKIESELAKAD